MTNDRTEPTPTQVLAMLDRAQALARRAMDAGHHPFGALLVDADHATVLRARPEGHQGDRPVAAVEEPIAALHRRHWRSR